MIVVIGAEVVFIVELAGVSFVAYCAVEEAHGGGEGVVSLVRVALVRGLYTVGMDVVRRG